MKNKNKTEAYKDAEKSFLASWKKSTKRNPPNFDLLVAEFHKGIYAANKGGSPYLKVFDIVNYYTTRWMVKDDDGEFLLISYLHDIGVPFYVTKLVKTEEELAEEESVEEDGEYNDV